MRTWKPLLVVLALSVAGCTVPGAEEPETPPDMIQTLPYVEPEPTQPPRGRLEVRWAGGAWSSDLSWNQALVINATGPVTQLPAPDVPERFEARFVGDLDPDGVWRLAWTAENRPYFFEYAEGGGTFSAAVQPGRTVVRLEIWDEQYDRYAAFGPALIDVASTWEVHGVVQPLPVQAPGAPPVQQEIRVPVQGAGGTMRLATEAEGDLPPTGRDLRLGYRYGREEVCRDGPTPGVNDHTDHLLEFGLWGEGTVVRAFVGNPNAWCGGGLDGPTNAEPIAYVLRVDWTAPAYS